MKEYINTGIIWVKRHSSTILTIAGVVGMIGTTIISVRNTPKAMRLIDIKEKELGRAVTVKEAVKETWKLYAAPVAMGSVSIACIFAGAKINAIRSAAVETVAANAINSLNEYKKAMLNRDPEKADEIEKCVAEGKLKENPIQNTNAVITGAGQHLCYDKVFGVYFRSDKLAIGRAVNEVNRKMVSYHFVSVNDLYEELGIPTIGIGDELGWTIDEGVVDVDVDSMVASNGEPCLVIDYTVKPRFGYSEF